MTFAAPQFRAARATAGCRAVPTCSKLILFGKSSLRLALKHYVTHFHDERNHQGKGNLLLFRASEKANRVEGPVRCRQRHGGLLRHYIGKPHEFLDPTGKRTEAEDRAKRRRVSVFVEVAVVDELVAIAQVYRRVSFGEGILQGLRLLRGNGGRGEECGGKRTCRMLSET